MSTDGTRENLRVSVIVRTTDTWNEDLTAAPVYTKVLVLTAIGSLYLADQRPTVCESGWAWWVDDELADHLTIVAWQPDPHADPRSGE